MEERKATTWEQFREWSEADLERELDELVRYEATGRGDYLADVVANNEPLVRQALDYKRRQRERHEARVLERIRGKARRRPLFEFDDPQSRVELGQICARALDNLFARELSPAERSFCIEAIELYDEAKRTTKGREAANA